MDAHRIVNQNDAGILIDPHQMLSLLEQILPAQEEVDLDFVEFLVRELLGLPQKATRRSQELKMLWERRKQSQQAVGSAFGGGRRKTVVPGDTRRGAGRGSKLLPPLYGVVNTTPDKKGHKNAFLAAEKRLKAQEDTPPPERGDSMSKRQSVSVNGGGLSGRDSPSKLAQATAREGLNMLTR